VTNGRKPSKPHTLASVVVIVAALAFAYAGVLARLVNDWAADDNYSHGFLIVPLALYFAWRRRDDLAAAARKPSALGLLLVLASLGVFAVGVLGVERFLTRVSLLGVIAGCIVFTAGWGALRILAFPLAFLLLMIPLPAIVFNQIAFPLQLLASHAGESALGVAGVPVLREGNVITLANTTLQVAEACSGIRSLVSLLTLAIAYGYFVDERRALRVLLAAAAVPIAIVTNALRVAGTGLAAYFVSPSAAEGFFHTFSGWVVFLVAVMLLALTHRALSALWYLRDHARPAPAQPSRLMC
jgi:exosortase